MGNRHMDNGQQHMMSCERSVVIHSGCVEHFFFDGVCGTAACTDSWVADVTLSVKWFVYLITGII